MIDLVKENAAALYRINLMGGFVSFAAYFIGFKFPDWDFKMKLKHRNILTHSPLMTLILIIFYLREPNDISRFFIGGFSLGMGIHFIFDLFPKKWSGGALIQIPILGKSLSPRWSQLFFKISSLISLTITVVFSRFEYELLLFFLLGIVTLIKNMAKEKKLIRPLLIYTVLFFIFSVIKYESLSKIILGKTQWFLDIAGQ